MATDQQDSDAPMVPTGNSTNQLNVESASTPHRPKLSHSHGSQSGRLEDARSDLIKDAGHVPVISFQDFKEHLLPVVNNDQLNLDESAVKRLLSHCISDGLLEPLSDGQHRWKYFPQNPKEVKGHENDVFRPLKRLWDDMIGIVNREFSTQPLARMEITPNKTPSSERPANTRPDAVVELTRDTTVTDPVSAKVTDARWENIAIAMEFKKVDCADSLLDDAQKVLYNCTHILRNDPCRRFTFAITIENTQLRLWHFARSGIMTTEPINWMEDHTNVIRVFTSFSFASEIDMGYDPTVKRICDNHHIQYEYAMTKGTYVTTGEPLFDFRADSSTGRATRVWKVYEKGGDPNIFFVLKDLWMFSDAKQEGDILRDLFKKIDQKDHKYFLTVVTDGKVLIDKDRLDQSIGTIFRAVPKILSRYIIQRPQLQTNPPPTVTGSARVRSHGHMPRDLGIVCQSDSHQSGFSPRTHYRIVFQEVCQPLHDIRDLDTAFSVLRQTANALKVLHSHHIVHGDLSTGNILSHNGMLKLADLEYSRVVDKERTHILKTGTAEFMSVEVAATQYIFCPATRIPQLNVADDGATTLASAEIKDDDDFFQSPNKAVAVEVAQPVLQPKPFRYGLIHDIESLWWIAIWFLFRTTPKGTAPLDKAQEVAINLFFRKFDGITRVAFINNDATWDSNTASLPPAFLPTVKNLGLFRSHYRNIAETTYASLDSDGIVYKIPLVDYINPPTDVYKIIDTLFRSPSVAIELIDTTKRKEGPEGKENPSSVKRVKTT